uniref:Variant surface glycoprotein n=1 Tax=Trypanosoma brucei TaxID=5691 RepID=C1K663_9TRYP|nr:variant surface glycoprotein [Trypanosoma brucei]
MPALNFLYALTVLAATHTSADKGDGLIQKSWSKICKLSDDLAKVSGGAWHKLDTALTLQDRLEQTALRCAIFSSTADNPEMAKQARLLQAFFARKAQAVASDVKTNLLEKAIKATRESSYAQGRLSEFLQTAAATKASGKGCLLGHDNSGYYHAKKLQGEDNTECDLEPQELKLSPLEIEVTDADGFTNGLEPGVADSHQTQGTKECGLLTAHGNNGLAKSGALDQNPKLLMGVFTVASSNSALTVADLTKAATSAKSQIPAWAKAHAAVKAIQDANPAANDNTSTSEDTAELQTAIMHLELQAATADSRNMKEETKKIFTNKVQDTITKVLHNVYSHQITVPFVNNGKDTPLRSIPNTGELMEILAFYEQKVADNTAKIQKELTEAQQAMKTDRSGDGGCTQITEPTACNSKPFCTYNETETDTNKKCKFNETKALKSGVSATQAQTGGTETTKDKCKGKSQTDCKDGCKWEGTECKDSSFLLTKKFALSVVSAAFVTLLF